MTLEAFQHILIDQAEYVVAEHPQAKGMPYGQEGRKAVVYQLVDGFGMPHALKAFKSRFRIPHMTLVAEKLAPYAGWNGLRACQRTVLTASRHAALISDQPELIYAELMPWIEGRTWQEVLLGRMMLAPEQSLAIARSLASILVRMEENGVAHCDLSAPNLILTPLQQIELVDLEEMYLPGFQRPGAMPSGSPGYGHRTAANGLWSSNADRFSGALLLAEMLGWCDEQILQAAWGESYFSPENLQQDCSRYQLLVKVLDQRCGKRIAELFARAWTSDTLDDCPTLGEWLIALPVSTHIFNIVHECGEEDEIPVEAGSLLGLAVQYRSLGNVPAALDAYQQALSLTPADHSQAEEIRQAIWQLQQDPPQVLPNLIVQTEPSFDQVAAAWQDGQANQPAERWQSPAGDDPDFNLDDQPVYGQPQAVEPFYQPLPKKRSILRRWAIPILIFFSLVGLFGFVFLQVLLSELTSTAGVEPTATTVPTLGAFLGIPTAANSGLATEAPPAATAVLVTLPTLAPAAYQNVQYTYVIKAGIWLRAGPDVYHPPTINVSGLFGSQDRLEVTAKSPDGYWYLVRTPSGEEGWIYRDWIDLSFNLPAVSVAVTIPTRPNTPVATLAPTSVPQRSQPKDPTNTPPYPFP